jgi:hypothetical protein
MDDGTFDGLLASFQLLNDMIATATAVDGASDHSADDAAMALDNILACTNLTDEERERIVQALGFCE